MQPLTYQALRACLDQSDPQAKCEAVDQAWATARDAGWDLDSGESVTATLPPGRPPRPVLVAPGEVPRRRLGHPEGRAALVHAIAHIEFNAINLALDAAWRFRDMPPDFSKDWLSVAVDESRHFRMLQARLQALGCTYGDYPAHNGLWEMAEKTAHSVLERMALVPRVLEARGLDVTPGMMQRLQQAGDEETVAILAVILDEEVRHVDIGSRWFRWCCHREGVSPESTFMDLLQQHFSGGLRGPFNQEARSRAGFSDAELAALGVSKP